MHVVFPFSSSPLLPIGQLHSSVKPPGFVRAERHVRNGRRSKSSRVKDIEQLMGGGSARKRKGITDCVP